MDAANWFALVQHELLLFAAVFFLIGALDEIAVDFTYLFMRLTGRARTPRIPENAQELIGPPVRTAVFIPTWREASVIGLTLNHALDVWKRENLTIYVGCYANDPETLASAIICARSDNRVRLVVHDVAGPTSKADNLNSLYAALRLDEQRSGETARMVVLHDAEDMVDPLGLAVMQRAMTRADFVQLPVLALPQPGSRWIGGHYSEEFAEAHAKTMVVRDWLNAAMPGAGVGCAIDRDMLARLAESEGGAPFAAASLTEDYELGLKVKRLGGRAMFARIRTEDGRLIATRAFFPAELADAVRQKTRWVHGIALQSWDRMGWHGRLRDIWMQARDRRGPFAAMLLALAYTLVVIAGLELVLVETGLLRPIEASPLLRGLLLANFAALVWRMVLRAAFTAREYGWREGLLAVPRIIVSNIIAIMACRRALSAYVASLRGQPARWEKTEHRDHPATVARDRLPA